MSAIQEAEKIAEENEEIIENIKYKRARELLQRLPNET